MKNIRIILALVLAMLTLCGAATAKEAEYDAAMALYKAGDYEQAIAAFEALGSYEDSQKMLANSKWYWKEQRYDMAVALHEAQNYAEAKPLFEALDGFRESKTYLEQINAAFAAQELLAYEQECYDKAVQARADGDLEAARDWFIQSGDTLDSNDQLYEILEVLARDQVYERAVADLNRGQYEDAIVRFEMLGDHLDSADKAAEARAALLAQRYEEAAAAEDVSRAYLLFLDLGEYQDSAAQAESRKADTGIITLYNAAEELRRAGRFSASAAGYAMCEGYKDSEERAEEMAQNAEKSAQFERAHILTDLWQLEEANAIYKALDDYSYARRMGMERIPASQLRDDATTDMSDTFTAPDGTTHRYRMFKGVHRWVEAEAFCRALGGHMATMTSAEENEFVYWFMRDNDFLTAYFGLEDEERDHTWEWVTGEPVEYLNWNPGEPSYSGRERYGMYFYKHLKGTWNDAHFYEDAEVDPGCSFICEWED